MYSSPSLCLDPQKFIKTRYGAKNQVTFMHFLVVSLSCLVCTLSPQARDCADGWNCLVVAPPLAVFYSQVGTHTTKQNKTKGRFKQPSGEAP